MWRPGSSRFADDRGALLAKAGEQRPDPLFLPPLNFEWAPAAGNIDALSGFERDCSFAFAARDVDDAGYREYRGLFRLDLDRPLRPAYGRDRVGCEDLKRFAPLNHQRAGVELGACRERLAFLDELVARSARCADRQIIAAAQDLFRRVVRVVDQGASGRLRECGAGCRKDQNHRNGARRAPNP